MTYIFGAGGHGRVVLDALRAANVHVDAFVDGGKVGECIGGLQVLGEDVVDAEDTVFPGIGSNAVRERVATAFETRGAVLGTAIHPRACVAPDAEIGPGTLVAAGAIVNTGAVVGRGCILNTGSVVEHDCRLGAYVHISPNATLGGEVHVGPQSWIGIGATVLPRVHIGKRTIVGGGGVATRDIGDDEVAIGVPARVRAERT